MGFGFLLWNPLEKKLKPILSAAKDPLGRSSHLGILRFILEPSLKREQNGRLRIGKEHRYFSLRMGFGFLFMESTRKKIETNPEHSEGSPRPEPSLGDSSLFFGAFIRKEESSSLQIGKVHPYSRSEWVLVFYYGITRKKLKPILSVAKDPLDRSSLFGILRFFWSLH
jgi:hypothetical protein